jgi:hypothetical protein
VIPGCQGTNGKWRYLWHWFRIGSGAKVCPTSALVPSQNLVIAGVRECREGFVVLTAPRVKLIRSTFGPGMFTIAQSFNS